MALQPCRECHVRISTEANACPRCGCPNPTTMPLPQEELLPLREGPESHNKAEETENFPASVYAEPQEETLSEPPLPKYILLRWFTILPVVAICIWFIDHIFLRIAVEWTGFTPENKSRIFSICRTLAGTVGRASVPIVAYYWAPWGKLKAANTLTIFSAVMTLFFCFFIRPIHIPSLIGSYIGLALGWLLIRRKDKKSGGGW
jgi:hypothetical protein